MLCVGTGHQVPWASPHLRMLFNPFNIPGNLVSLSILEMKRRRLRRLSDASKVTRVAMNELLVFDKWLSLFLLYLTSPKRLRDGKEVRDRHKLG